MSNAFPMICRCALGQRGPRHATDPRPPERYVQPPLVLPDDGPDIVAGAAAGDASTTRVVKWWWRFGVSTPSAAGSLRGSPPKGVTP